MDFNKSWFKGRRAIAVALLVIAELIVPEGVRADMRGDKAQKAVPLSTYETALKYLQKNDCERGQEILQPMIKEGAGNEVALLDIGYCYVQKASQTSDPAAAASLRKIGVDWILRAANAGQRRGQQELARQYLEGGVFAPDPKEAGKWFLIWKSNRGAFQVDPTASDQDLERKLQSTLTAADWEVARARAEAWHPVIDSER